MKLILRGHHLLCLMGFQGYGYSEEFTKNMTEINEMRHHKDTAVTLTDSPDDICRACPNLKDGICENPTQNEKIVTMDRQVLEKFDIKRQYCAPELFEETDSVFSTKESVSKICCECMWHEQCLFYLNCARTP